MKWPTKGELLFGLIIGMFVVLTVLDIPSTKGAEKPTEKEIAIMRSMANRAIINRTNQGVRSRTVHPRRYTASNYYHTQRIQNGVAARNAYRRGQFFWYRNTNNYIPPLKVRRTRYGLRYYRW